MGTGGVPLLDGLVAGWVRGMPCWTCSPRVMCAAMRSIRVARGRCVRRGRWMWAAREAYTRRHDGYGRTTECSSAMGVSGSRSAHVAAVFAGGVDDGCACHHRGGAKISGHLSCSPGYEPSGSAGAGMLAGSRSLAHSSRFRADMTGRRRPPARHWKTRDGDRHRQRSRCRYPVNRDAARCAIRPAEAGSRGSTAIRTDPTGCLPAPASPRWFRCRRAERTPRSRWRGSPSPTGSPVRRAPAPPR